MLQIRFHGVLAPNPKRRAMVVSAGPVEDAGTWEAVVSGRVWAHPRPARMSCARLLERVPKST